MNKNIIIISIILITLFSTNLFGQFNQPGMKYYPIETEIKNNYTRYDTIPAPEWEFITFPAELMTSYWDYMPGGYKTHPIRLQTENGDGVYMTFHGIYNLTDNRRQYWAYLDSQSNLVDWGTITTYDNWQGFGSIAVHPATGDCIASWHENYDGDPNDIIETTITYDDYDLIEIPGFWQTPMVIYQDGTNEYIWPLVYVGPSPSGDSYVRVYQLAHNFIPDPFGNPCEDVRIMHIDVENVNGIDFSSLLNLANWNTVTLFSDWREKSCRPFQSFGIDFNNPGRVAFIGYAVWQEGDLGNMPVEEGFFVYESLDYGETWTLYDFGMPPAIENLLQLEDNQGNVLESIEFGILGFHNTALFDGEGNLHWCYTGSYGYTDDAGNWNYFDHFIPACEFVWFGDDIIEWRNVWPKVPWEVEGSDTLIHYSLCTPFPPDYCYLDAFIGNSMKNAISCENEWIVQVWADGTYHMLGMDGDPQYQDYIGHPILFMSCSNDNGEHWTEPIEITDIYTPPFDDQITVYPYICDQIVGLGDGWGEVYIYYLDDNWYGPSFCSVVPMNVTGQITYCSFKINFDSILVEIDEEQEQQIPEIFLYNYPNPMRNSTTISFLATDLHGLSQIKIYNVKGQLVKELEVRSKELRVCETIWNSKDKNGRELPNGIYLYQLNIGDQVITKKMILLR